jgi:HD-GYP domain-containing protein (c-di-GMP phosphodiesterase class II)
VCEALTADRPYRAALEPDQVQAIMRRDAGSAFCHEALAALEATRELGPVGLATPGPARAPRAAR